MARTEVQVLLNEPIVLMIGRPDAPRRIEICEPSNDQLGEYLALLNKCLSQMLKDNLPLITGALKGEDVSALSFDISSFSNILTPFVARIIGEDVEYVQTQMSGRQSVAVIHAFLNVVGWEFIRESFRQATTAWKQAGSTTKSESAEAPSWLAASSSK